MQPSIIRRRCFALASAQPSNRRIARRAFSSSASKEPLPARKNPAQSRRALSSSDSQRQTEAPPSLDSQRQTEAPPLPSPVSSPNSTPPPLSNESGRVLLQPDNLFHSFSNSPFPDMRKRAAFIKQNAYCPHPDHQPTRQPYSPQDLEARKTGSLPPAHVRYECPDCGIPVSCSYDHFVDDYEAHLELCDTLREINEDDHDIRSGRTFREFEYPGHHIEEAQVNMLNWDTLLYTRDFSAIDDERSMRHATRLLTYPLTIGSVLHQLSPYDMKRGGRLTGEGLKSLSALRYTLHPPRDGSGQRVTQIRLHPPPVRLFCLGARAESSLPREVWVQLSHLFPLAVLNLILIGPESMANRDAEFPLPERTPRNPFGIIREGRHSTSLKISTYVDYFHTLHNAQHFYPYDPYFDVFVLFHPGLGHPSSSHEWAETLPQLLDTKVPIICTGYTQYDMDRDVDWVKENCRGEYDMLLEPGENRFRSLRWDLNDLDPNDISCGNWGVWAFRGKRYETDRYAG